MSIGVIDFGIISSLGVGPEETAKKLFSPERNSLAPYKFANGKQTFIGAVEDEFCQLPNSLKNLDSRNNQLLYRIFQQIAPSFEQLKKNIPLNRIGIVIGTSTSGISDVELAFQEKYQSGNFPKNYHYKIHEMGSAAEFLSELTNCKEIAYTVSCACSSGAKALISAARLLENNLCDLVIAGGVDTLCQLTLQGFDSLEVVSQQPCLPFSKNRSGINIGEGGALFLLGRENYRYELISYGESSDAYHHSAPHPEGTGAFSSMQRALDKGGIPAIEIDYINLHGTGTKQNDAMEAKAVAQLFGHKTLCSSTKSLTGHTLGAAGAIEAAFSLLTIAYQKLPIHHSDGDIDSEMPPLNLVKEVATNRPIKYVLSNSYAFGGNNCSLLFARGEI